MNSCLFSESRLGPEDGLHCIGVSQLWGMCGAAASQTLEEDTVEVGIGAPVSAAGWYRCRAVSSLPRCPRAYYAVLFLFGVGDGEHF